MFFCPYLRHRYPSACALDGACAATVVVDRDVECGCDRRGRSPASSSKTRVPCVVVVAIVTAKSQPARRRLDSMRSPFVARRPRARRLARAERRVDRVDRSRSRLAVARARRSTPRRSTVARATFCRLVDGARARLRASSRAPRARALARQRRMSVFSRRRPIDARARSPAVRRAVSGQTNRRSRVRVIRRRARATSRPSIEPSSRRVPNRG